MRTQRRGRATRVRAAKRTTRAGRRSRSLLAGLGTLAALLWTFPPAVAQDAARGPGAREAAGEVASLLELAAEEYGDAVRAGAVVDAAEYDEARAFGREAAARAADLEGEAARSLRDGLDALRRLLDERGPADEVAAEVERLTALLREGWGAAAFRPPPGRPSAARGALIYRSWCAGCHGETGRGDGPAAAGMEPPPADLASTLRRAEATPARDWLVTTWGIPETAMAGWRDRLDERARWDVVAYVQGLRTPGRLVSEGASLAGGDDSPVRGRVRAWSDLGRTARWTDGALAARVTEAFAAAGRPLEPPQGEAVAAWLRSLAGAPAAATPEPDRAWLVGERFDAVEAGIDRAFEAAAAGEVATARSAAVEAYLAFEPLEPEIVARAPARSRAVESAFVRFRGALGSPDLEAARADLLTALADAERTVLATASSWSVAVQSFVIILREGFEAILIVGALIAFLSRMGHGSMRRVVWGGAAAAVVASVGTALLVRRLIAAVPASPEVIEGVTMLVAVVVLFSVSYWLLSRLDHRRWEAWLRRRMGRALGAGGGLALAGVAFLAVYREGFETILFYEALAGLAEGRVIPLAGGFLAGCLALAAIYALFVRFELRIPLRPFFAVTSGVLYLMAFLFAGAGVRALQDAGWIGVTPVSGVPELPALGVFPTVETLAAQGLLVLLLAAGLVVTFAPALRASREEATTAA